MVYEELDEAKAELEKLREQYKVKVELAESLKRAHNEQLSKNKETSSKLEKLTQELKERDDSISTARQMYEELKSNLAEKESIIRQLTSARDKLRLDFTEKLRKCEEENKALALALDDANAKNMDQEQQISALKREIEGFKRLLTFSEKKCSLEAENKKKAPKELERREDAFLELEEEKRKFEDELKRKKEQFVHLEEAHEKLRNQFRMREREWEKVKELAMALDDANAKNMDQEQQICALEQEIEGFKRLLTFSEKKCLEVENKTRSSLELEGREDVFFKLEEEKRKFEDQLKWKKEQFFHLEEAHEKLQNQFRMREKEWEKVKEVALALDDANAKNMDQERQICALKQEIEGFKRLLNFSEMKCLEVENKTKASEEFGGREDAFFKLEEKKRKFEDQLKWKKEQFVHLEEAHEKLQNQFMMKEKEWEKEKAALLDGISSLQTNLESQTRISQDLKGRLEMCNQALAHAESKRKLLEVQLLESRESFDNICAEYDETKSNFENFTVKRDQEIATLRSSLGTKDILYKEMEYQFRKLEQEKQELLVSLKELQEAQIREAGFSSSFKLQNKLKSLEHVHKGCSTNLKEKESEWHSQMEKLSEELNNCRSALKSRDMSLNELNRELEACDSLILQSELLNQETSLALLVLKSEFSEAQLRLADNHFCMNLKNKQVQENMYELVEQLEQNKVALNSVQKDLEEEREKVVILSEKMQALEEVQFPLQKELERLNEMLKESTTCELKSEEQVLQIQSELRKVQDALDRANEELYEKFCEANEIEFELKIWKSMAEQLEVNLKQNHQMRREVEASLLAQVDVELNLKQEKESLSDQLEEKEKEINELQQQFVERESSLQNAAVRASFEFDAEAESLQQLVEEKDQRICDLQQLVASLEREFESSTTSFSSRLSRMLKEINILGDSWEKIKTNEILKEMEIQEKNTMIIELENDLGILLERVEQQDKTLLDSENKMQEIQVELEKKELEVRELERELEAKISTSEKTIKKMTENSMMLLAENKKLVNSMDSLSERMEQFTLEDQQLMESLGKIVEGIDISRPQREWNNDDEQDNVKENMNILLSSPLMKKVEAIHDQRSPLRAINS